MRDHERELAATPPEKLHNVRVREARDTGLCQSLASGLRLPAKVGDPMARFLVNGAAPKGLPDPQSSHPGWAVACGLASSPTDL